ncbi:hypothetical protein [Candidatus Hecatella orcuttiae]|jgi:hypothetical protein|uniref:hypothetical protein n=1 Tax=Candidatus Hecatella orcuttiae TaxID=1935119 RepID=UPI0028682C73|nr:hypothetical protein [Candidatus Hecatella orcuttiae]
MEEVKVLLQIDGKIVPLNRFAQRIFQTTLEGMVSALKGIPPAYRELSLSIKKK